MAHLVAITGPSAGKRYALERECVLGRSFNSDIYVGDLNVSRRHARVVASGPGDVYLLEDLGSGNGTFVNGTQIRRHRLRLRDVIRIGGSSFRYEPDGQPSWGEDVQTMIADLVEDAPATDGELARLSELGVQLKGRPPGTAPSQPAAARVGGDGDRASRMLLAMYAVADAMATELDLPRLLIKVLDHLFDVFPQAERGFVLLKNQRTGQLVPEAVKRRGGEDAGISFSQTMVDQLMARESGVIRGDTIPPRAVARPGRPGRPQSRSKLAPKVGAQLRVRSEVLGTLHLEGRERGERFSEEDLELLSAIARQVAVAIANARAGQALLEQQRLEADLQLARKIQQSFLPKRLPLVPGLEIATHYVPAQHVGGDFFDIIELDSARIGILVGDISGKGVGAALLMARVASDLRLLSRSCGEPAEILTHANRSLMEAEQDAMFATVLYVMLDLRSGRITVANAGHQPAMVLGNGRREIVELDDATSVALGVVSGMRYPQHSYDLASGDVVLLYTDGINEARNREGGEYGMERQRRAAQSGPCDPDRVIQRVVADIRRFVGLNAQSDDQTIVSFALSHR